MKDDCLFCKIVRKEIPSKILYEDDDILVMLDAFPDTDGHTLVIPKEHFEDIYEIPNEVLIKMISIDKAENIYGGVFQLEGRLVVSICKRSLLIECSFRVLKYDFKWWYACSIDIVIKGKLLVLTLQLSCSFNTFK